MQNRSYDYGKRVDAPEYTYFEQEEQEREREPEYDTPYDYSSSQNFKTQHQHQNSSNEKILVPKAPSMDSDSDSDFDTEVPLPPPEFENFSSIRPVQRSHTTNRIYKNDRDDLLSSIKNFRKKKLKNVQTVVKNYSSNINTVSKKKRNEKMRRKDKKNVKENTREFHTNRYKKKSAPVDVFSEMLSFNKNKLKKTKTIEKRYDYITLSHRKNYPKSTNERNTKTKKFDYNKTPGNIKRARKFHQSVQLEQNRTPNRGNLLDDIRKFKKKKLVKSKPIKIENAYLRKMKKRNASYSNNINRPVKTVKRDVGEDRNFHIRNQLNNFNRIRRGDEDENTVPPDFDSDSNDDDIPMPPTDFDGGGGIPLPPNFDSDDDIPVPPMMSFQKKKKKVKPRKAGSYNRGNLLEEIREFGKYRSGNIEKSGDGHRHERNNVRRNLRVQKTGEKRSNVPEVDYSNSHFGNGRNELPGPVYGYGEDFPQREYEVPKQSPSSYDYSDGIPNAPKMPQFMKTEKKKKKKRKQKRNRKGACSTM